jgi:beta-mannosidase
VSTDGVSVAVKAYGFARSVEIWSEDSDLLLEDNFFDMSGGEKTVRILEGRPSKLRCRSVFDIR